MTELSKIYTLIIDTLTMICPDLNVISGIEIEDYLSELEGDYYTFFDIVGLLPLHQGGMLTADQMNNIAELKNVINKIPVALWHKDAFRNDGH